MHSTTRKMFVIWILYDEIVLCSIKCTKKVENWHKIVILEENFTSWFDNLLLFNNKVSGYCLLFCVNKTMWYFVFVCVWCPKIACIIPYEMKIGLNSMEHIVWIIWKKVCNKIITIISHLISTCDVHFQ